MKSKILLFFVIIFLVCPAVIYAYVFFTSANLSSLPPLQDGDLVFHTGDSGQTLAIWMATGSLYSHMGIIKIGADGNPLVVEAAGPVRETPLQEWIARGWFGRLTVMRVRGLTPKYAKKLLEAAKEHYGKPYDPFFLFEKERIYCSELVYWAFKKGIGVEIGQVQSFRELEYENGTVQSLILLRWEKYPPCLESGIDELDECLSLIYDQKLITPISIAKDRRIETIYSNY
jgi:hypothetical protein